MEYLIIPDLLQIPLIPGAGNHQLGTVPGPQDGHQLANRSLGSLA